ncbi:hypothetical protein Clacol_004050 [Clathrus columnatus]|uniref:RING-type domain-containing protein n=1 Tax=Clathrus columnatus TaxID=1419009 RepID=A0AAV5A5A7_9AGAM|nr:hypothetical protein Clacol_004050 [Clathrus columnatus]
MFSRLFKFFSLKRKFSSSGEEGTTIAESSTNRPTKRVRIEELSSTLEERTQPNTPVHDVCIIDDGEEEELEVLDEIIPRGMKGKEVERLEDLEEEVKETRAIAARLREETRNYIESVDRVMNCVVCLDFIHNPQVLSECGHTICYPCLRSWFTRDTDDSNEKPMISTDEESEGEDTIKPGPSNATPPPRRRHRFPSAINTRKVCPECLVIITRPPTPLFRLRHLTDALNGSESPVPFIMQSPQNRKLHEAWKSKDLWYGIYPGPNGDKKSLSRLDFQNAELAVADEGRQPIVEQAEAVLQDEDLEWMHWPDVMDEAREEGRRQIMRELRRDQERLHEERRCRRENIIGEQLDQDQPIERRIRGLPLRRARTPSPPAPLSPVVPIIPRAPLSSPIQGPTLLSPPPPQQRQWMPFPLSRPARPTRCGEFWSGLDDASPRPTYPIFVIPPPAPSTTGPFDATCSSASRPSNCGTQGTSTQQSPGPAILESLQQFHRQFSPQHTTEGCIDDDEWYDVDDNDDDDDDADLPLITHRTSTPPSSPNFEREYPVYVEDLHLEEDLSQEPHPNANANLSITSDDDRRVGLLFPYHHVQGPVQEAEEGAEERLSRLFSEGEDGGGVGLE